MEPIPCRECYVQLFSEKDPEELTKKISTFLGEQPATTKLVGTTNLRTDVSGDKMVFTMGIVISNKIGA